jgi:hypothetical protein
VGVVPFTVEPVGADATYAVRLKIYGNMHTGEVSIEVDRSL